MSDHEMLLAISGMLDTKLRSALEPIKVEIQALKEEVQVLKEEVQVLKEEVQVLKEEVQALKEEMRCIKLFQENVIMPRLNTIEACYTDTFRRYAAYTERIEATFEDVEMLKIVVAEHSEKLQKLA